MLSKLDLVSSATALEVWRRVRQINPLTHIVPAVRGHVDAATLIDWMDATPSALVDARDLDLAGARGGDGRRAGGGVGGARFGEARFGGARFSSGTGQHGGELRADEADDADEADVGRVIVDDDDEVVEHDHAHAADEHGHPHLRPHGHGHFGEPGGDARVGGHAVEGVVVHEHDHSAASQHQHVATFSVVRDGHAAEPLLFARWLRRVATAKPDEAGMLYRSKGVLAQLGRTCRLVFHAVVDVADKEEAGPWPSGMPNHQPSP